MQQAERSIDLLEHYLTNEPKERVLPCFYYSVPAIIYSGKQTHGMHAVITTAPTLVSTLVTLPLVDQTHGAAKSISRQ